MTHFKSIPKSDGSAFDVLYGESTKEEIVQKIEDAFQREGYSIKEGELGNRTYVKGNRVVRLLLGAFYKYFEFHIGAHPSGEDILVSVTKTTSGMSGGVIGIGQVKNELIRLQSVLAEI